MDQAVYQANNQARNGECVLTTWDIRSEKLRTQMPDPQDRLRVLEEQMAAFHTRLTALEDQVSSQRQLEIATQWFLTVPIGFVVEEVFFRGALDTYLHHGEEGAGYRPSSFPLYGGSGTCQRRHPLRGSSFPRRWSCSQLRFSWVFSSRSGGAKAAIWWSTSPRMPCWKECATAWLAMASSNE